MDQYIHRENIALFRKRLSETSDPALRNVLLKLLAEEQAKDDPLYLVIGAGGLTSAVR